MLAGSALHTWIYFQAKAAGRRGLCAPRRHDEKLLADQERRPRFFGGAHPIGIGSFVRLAEPRGGIERFEVCIQSSVAFDDAERSGFPQLRRAHVEFVGLRVQAHEIHCYLFSMPSAVSRSALAPSVSPSASLAMARAR